MNLYINREEFERKYNLPYLIPFFGMFDTVIKGPLHYRNFRL